ncbi:MAG TPA: TonB-dependent receptor plug domain-containing protein [Opitutaceae bacterium]
MPTRLPHATCLVASIVCCALPAAGAAATAEGKRTFNVPRGDAATTLSQFAGASGRQIVFMMEKVRGEQTNAVQGEYSPREALDRMLAGTALVALQDENTGGFLVRRAAPPPPAAEPAPPSPPKPKAATQEPSPSMKRKNLLAAFAGWLALAGSPALQAQATPPGTPPKGARDEVVELNPFVVNTSKDIGYQAQSTLSGSRTNTDLKDLANPIDIFTKELMEDLGVRDIQDLTLFATGVEPNAAGDNNSDGQEREIWNYNYMQIRGFKTGTATRNFMELNSTFDAYNSERVEFSKGPNSILFGTGNPGGSSNYSTKVPAFHKSSYSVQWGLDDEDTTRLTVDANQRVSDKFALRLNLLRQEREFYRKPAYHDEKAAHLVASLKPFKNTTVTVGHEYRDSRRASPRGVFPYDAITAYRTAGSARVTGVPATGNNVQIEGSAATVPVANLGLRVYGTNWILDSDGQVRNAARTVTGANHAINGVGSLSLPVESIGYPRNQVVGGANGVADVRWRITEADVTQRFGENFYVSLAFGRSESFKRQTNSVDNVLKVDANYFGGNTHAGQYYIETNPFRIDIDNKIVDYRATASYDLDLRKVNRWLGSHQLGAMVERNERQEIWDHGRLVLTGAPAGPIDLAATYGATRLQNTSARFYIRDYLDFSRGIYSGRDLRELLYSDGVRQNGYTAEFRRITAFAAKKDFTRQETALAVLHSKWWDGRLVTTAGVRDDRREFRTALFQNDAITGERRPVSVIDGATPGSFDPRDARLPDKPEVLTGVSKNLGGVFHVTPWLSVNYSYATNFSPGTESLNIFGERVPRSTGESRDYGFRLHLLNGRLSVSLLRYETSEIGTIINGGSVNAPNSRLDAIEDILLDHGITRTNPLTGGAFTTSDRVARGEEFMIIGNPTSGWNLRLSASRNVNRLTNIAPEVKAFFAEREALYVQHSGLRALSGAGETIGERLALVRTDLGLLSTRENVQQFPASEYTARLTAKYSFDRSPLLKIRGFSAGGNYRWASAPIIGYYKNANSTFDAARSYKGEQEKSLDLFFIYQKRLNDRFTWRVQLNIDNVLDDTDPYPVSAVNDVDAAGYRWMVTRLRPVDGRVIRLTNTISF